MSNQSYEYQRVCSWASQFLEAQSHKAGHKAGFTMAQGGMAGITTWRSRWSTKIESIRSNKAAAKVTVFTAIV